MARRASKHLRPPRPLHVGAAETAAVKSDGRWFTRPISSQRAVKAYTCPGCLHAIAPGTSHIVAWPSTPPLGSQSGVDHRRHWHSECWRRRP